MAWGKRSRRRVRSGRRSSTAQAPRRRQESPSEPSPTEAESASDLRRREPGGTWNPFTYLRKRRDASRRQAFAERIREELHDVAWIRSYRFDEERFALVQSDTEREVCLDAAFERYHRARERERATILEELRRELIVPPVHDDFARAAPHLRLEVCCRASHEICKLANPESRAQRIVRPLSETLSVALYYQSSAGMFACTHDQLERWGCPVGQAFSEACSNAGKLGSELFTQGLAGVRIARLGNRLGGALWRADELLEGLELRGAPIAMILDGKQLLVADSGAPASLTAMLKIARSSPTRDGLPLAALRYSSDGWVRYRPLDDNYPAELRSLELSDELRAFERQRLLLEALHVQARDPVQVVPAEVAADGSVYTFCRWTRQGELLLPVTDRIQLPALEGSGPRTLAWSEVMPKLGDLVETTPHFPPRVRVRQLPPLSVLRTLYAASNSH